jgi:hypothetical protein
LTGARRYVTWLLRRSGACGRRWQNVTQKVKRLELPQIHGVVRDDTLSYRSVLTFRIT